MRVFWLGMHKVLSQTELPRLRELGFEVFSPQYLSSVKDQSATPFWDNTQPTTLPREIFEKLRTYNFFFNPISPEMADLLNTYFDAVIVTISVDWLAAILKVYKKKVIFRTYGQSYLLSEYLWKSDLFKLITEKDDFWFVPHAEEAVYDEHAWLRDRECIVPYSPTPDVFLRQETWKGDLLHEIMCLCPHIDNLYYRAHYNFLKKHFKDASYRFYGVQLRTIKDPQVVGNLPRDAYLDRFVNSKGYLYSYSDEHVCYLPPIEMMIIGGPVLFFKGSLLDRYFEGKNAPGRLENLAEAHAKCALLLKKDKSFIQDVINSQEFLKKRYHPNHTLPIFDRVFSHLLHKDTRNKAPQILYSKNVGHTQRSYLLYHFPRQPIRFHRGCYSAHDGISRVIRLMIRALCEKTNDTLVITCRRDQLVSFYGFFSDSQFKGRISFLLTDHKRSLTELITQLKFHLPKKFKEILALFLLRSGLYRLKSFFKTRVHFGQVYAARFQPKAPAWIYRLYQKLKPKKTSVSVTNLINEDTHCHQVIVPHYSLFPEALSIKQKIVLYLPDYIPHFFENTNQFKEVTSLDKQIGQKMAEHATRILTPSEFTKSYLPKTVLKVPSSKIHTFYLPLLNQTHTYKLSTALPNLQGKSFLFYPTQVRPNKNLSFLLEVFHKLLEVKPHLFLVLTSYLYADPIAFKLYKKFPHKNQILFVPKASDNTLQWLYEHASVLSFTSLMEGNFPPQIFEALTYQTPIVATKIPLITELLSGESDLLLLSDPHDLEDFTCKTLYALEHKEEVLKKQQRALELVTAKSSWSQFAEAVVD